jgi:plastocyanin
VKLLVLLILAAGSLGLMACANAAAETVPEKGVTRVLVKDMKYAPPAIEVPAGTEVTWTFADGLIPHDVKGDGFQSPLLRDGTFTHRFHTPGTYAYYCTLHSQMRGRVIVTG